LSLHAGEEEEEEGFNFDFEEIGEEEEWRS
jgi:hypothetical protein